MTNLNWSYTPFLKMKQNEIMAVRELKPLSRVKTVPFFDFPKGNDESLEMFQRFAKRGTKQIKTHLGRDYKLYLDTHDVNEFVDGTLHSYEYLLNLLTGCNTIAVTGLNRSPEHHTSIINCARAGTILTTNLGFRVNYEDIESYTAIESEIDDTLSNFESIIGAFDLIIDLRICTKLDTDTTARRINSFVSKFMENYPTGRVIVTGSSITSIVTDMCEANTDKDFDRKEIEIYLKTKQLAQQPARIEFGDYTTVSPNFTEPNFPVQLMRHRTVSKLIYSHSRVHHIWRGTTLHLEGDKQYNQHALSLTNKPFYRGPNYSWADNQLYIKRNNIDGLSASTMIKHTVNAHLEFMINNAV